MRARYTVLTLIFMLLELLAAVASSLGVRRASTTHSDHFKASKEVSSDLPSSIESAQDQDYSNRLLGTSEAEDDSKENETQATTDADGDTEERTINRAMTAKLKVEQEAFTMRLAYKYWFDGGKTVADVRLIMGLPAKGDDIGHANWGNSKIIGSFEGGGDYSRQRRYS